MAHILIESKGYAYEKASHDPALQIACPQKYVRWRLVS